MLETAKAERNLWSEYSVLHQKHPKSDSEAKVCFYNHNSEFIIRGSKTPNPELAVVIPAFNESDLIARTLAGINSALLHSDNKSVSVIVVDNASTDSTAEIASTFGATVVRENKKGFSYARQAGFEALPSSVRYFFSTDADTVVPHNWFSSHLESLTSQDDVVLTYGKIKPIIDQNKAFFKRFLLFEYNSMAKLLHLLRRESKPHSYGGANMAYNKNAVLECGGYNLSLTYSEDTDIMERLSHIGSIVRVDNEILTSARRIVGNGILRHQLHRINRNIQYMIIGRDIDKLPQNPEYPDYR